MALGEGEVAPAFSTLGFHAEPNEATRLGEEKSSDVVAWKAIRSEVVAWLGPKTKAAAALFDALFAIHRDVRAEEGGAYVPFKPQLVQQEQNGELVIHLVGEPVKRELLGVNAWFHDWDGRVRTTSVPRAHADIWRVGWAVADVLGIAADMSGETGNREEMLAEDFLDGETSVERQQQVRAELIEGYVLRQQLRKLQGTYLSEAHVDLSDAGLGQQALPRTVRRALDLLRDYPAMEDVRAKARYVLAMEAETRAMALCLRSRAGADLRNSLHLVFPETIERLPLWLLQGIDLAPAGPTRRELRPELSLMAALYHVMQGAPEFSRAGQDAEIAPALRIALALAAATAGLRGCVAALWGLTQGNKHRLKDRLCLPAGWVLPEELRADPQADYSAICKWLTEADWVALGQATPWHWMLAMVGLLESSFPRVLEVPALADVFSRLSAWRYEAAVQEEPDVLSERAVWPFEGLPNLRVLDCDALVNAITKAVVDVDNQLGIHVAPEEAPSFRRDPHSDEFTDAKGIGWQMSKPQYTSLGGGGVERVMRGKRRLSAWTETRRKTDGELVAVHWLGGKLGNWLALKGEHEAVSAVEGFPLAEGEGGMLSTRSEIVAPPEPDAQQLPAGLEVGADADASVSNERMPKKEFNSPSDFFAAQRELQLRSFGLRKRKGADNGATTAGPGSHFRVALLQLRTQDSYSHPVTEVGIEGLPLGKSACDELAVALDNEDFDAARKAGRRGDEHHWKQTVNVISWPEHRRRAVLREALSACHRLGVELLVLPEVSVRKDTIQWMKEELAAHCPGLAVLAGTYRNFCSESHEDHLKEMTTLLWRPEKPLLDKFGLKDKETIALSRGKKYRSVAAHELFKPEAGALAPLYSDERVLGEITKLRGEEGWSPDQVKSLVSAFASDSPKLRYCMELICSELFLLTSPANREPLVQELERILTIFGQPAAAAAARDMVERDLQAMGDLLTIAQRQRERRSVLLVPAHTNRTNDYWHAGQASVLASGTATVFCNAVLDGANGGSCFVGIESVTHSSSSTGVVKLLTPYHGWHTGILQADCQGALSSRDQALVVVDIDPVHVVSGKPRPQLLPEPMVLVAYMPVVEVVDMERNFNALAEALVRADKRDQPTPEVNTGWEAHRPGMVANVEALLRSKRFKSGVLCDKKAFEKAYQLLAEVQPGKTEETVCRERAETFASFFGNAESVFERFNAWYRDRHQQPGVRVGGNKRSEPAWVDFLVADLTCSGDLPTVEVPAWCDLGSNGED